MKTVSAQEISELNSILNNWGVPELISTFYHINIDVETLKHLTDEDIRELIPIRDISLRCKFRNKLREWKILNGYEQSPTEVTNTFISTDYVNQLPSVSPSPSPSPAQSKRPASPAHFEFSFAKFLTTIKGQRILSMYTERNPPSLDSSTRELIVDSVIDEFVNNDKQMGSREFDRASKEIAEAFPNEKAEYYYVGGKSPTGRMFSRYKIRYRNLNEMGYFKESKRLKKSTNNMAEAKDRSAIVKAEPHTHEKWWLSQNQGPWSTISEYWKLTAENREYELYVAASVPAEIQTFLSEWPLLKSNYSVLLTNMDFENRYPQKKSLFADKFDNFQLLVVPVLLRNIKDKFCSKVLTNLPTDWDERCVEVFKMLHHVLKPTARIINKVSKVIWKIAIAESIESSILDVNLFSELDEKMTEQQKKYEDYGIAAHPYLVFARNEMGGERFAVKFNDIFQKFNTFVDAVDYCFKLFSILNMHYPNQCRKVWLFIQTYFFEINTTAEADIINLMTDLQC